LCLYTDELGARKSSEEFVKTGRRGRRRLSKKGVWGMPVQIFIRRRLGWENDNRKRNR